jgi:hypothetical protein
MTWSRAGIDQALEHKQRPTGMAIECFLDVIPPKHPVDRMAWNSRQGTKKIFIMRVEIPEQPQRRYNGGGQGN